MSTNGNHQTIYIGSRQRARATVPCGTGAPTLIIASVGTSSPADAMQEELEKVERASSLGAHVVTDHSFYGDIPTFHERISAQVDVGLSTVACYEPAALHEHQNWHGVEQQHFLDLLARQLDRGVDLTTIHASLRKEDALAAGSSNRLIPTTSKGGGIMSSYMRRSGNENPYYEHFDDVLRLLDEHGTVLSLGTSYRAATVVDQWDLLMANELRVMGELVDRAIDAGVGVMVEGLGHAPLQAIPTYVKLTKLHTRGVPYRVLPMATDRALGFDHVSGAIAGSAAVAAGADAITAMSRAEHIGLPTADDMEEALVATRIAAACGELAQLGTPPEEQQMARTRWSNGCKGDWTAAIYPEGAEDALRARGRLGDQLIQCGMCGDYCGIASGIATVQLSERKPRAHD